MSAVEQVHELRKPGDTDAVTFSWADAGAGLYGLARVATGLAADGAEQPSALAVVFSGREPLGAVAVAAVTDHERRSFRMECPRERRTDPTAATGQHAYAAHERRSVRIATSR